MSILVFGVGSGSSLLLGHLMLQLRCKLATFVCSSDYTVTPFVWWLLLFLVCVLPQLAYLGPEQGTCKVPNAFVVMTFQSQMITFFTFTRILIFQTLKFTSSCRLHSKREVLHVSTLVSPNDMKL